MPLRREGTPGVQQGGEERIGRAISPARLFAGHGDRHARLGRGFIETLLILASSFAAHAATAEAERCLMPASQFHQVNPQVLRAILKVESGLNPKAIARNRNGTLDVGIGQMNSIHFGELAKFGIAPGHLLDACVGTYVAAWHLRKQIARYGNTWYGIAAYHSATPRHNARYQLLLHHALVEKRR